MSVSLPRPRQQLDAAAFFDVEAALYDRTHDDPGPRGQALRSRLAVVTHMLGDGPGHVLDVGMGPGRLLAELAARGWTPHGVDVSEAMVARARERLGAEAADDLRTGRIEDLPVDDECLDAVVATGVLEYSSDLPRALAELHRILRPGGRAVLSLPNPRSAYALWYGGVVLPVGMLIRRAVGGRPERPPGQGAVGRERFEALLADTGLVLDRLEYASFSVVPAPFDRVLARTSARAARALEGSRPTLGRALATQVVFAAHKPRYATAAGQATAGLR